MNKCPECGESIDAVVDSNVVCAGCGAELEAVFFGRPVQRCFVRRDLVDAKTVRAAASSVPVFDGVTRLTRFKRDLCALSDRAEAERNDTGGFRCRAYLLDELLGYMAAAKPDVLSDFMDAAESALCFQSRCIDRVQEQMAARRKRVAELTEA